MVELIEPFQKQHKTSEQSSKPSHFLMKNKQTQTHVVKKTMWYPLDIIAP